MSPLRLASCLLLAMGVFAWSTDNCFAQDAAETKERKGFGSAEEGKAKAKEPSVGFGSGRSKAGKDSKEAKEGDEEKPESTEKAEKPGKAEKEDDEKGEDKKGNASKFGSDRKKEEKPDRPSKEERAKQKAVKSLERKLGRNEEGYFLIRLDEQKLEQQPADPNYPNARPRYMPVVTTKFLVLEGREKTAEFLYDYMSEFAPDPKEKVRRSRRDKELEGEDSTPQLPPPKRSYAAIGWFETNEQASFAEQRAKELLEAQKARQKEILGEK